MSAPCVTSSYPYLSEWPQPFPASSKRNSILAQVRFSQTPGSCGARLRRARWSGATIGHEFLWYCGCTACDGHRGGQMTERDASREA